MSLSPEFKANAVIVLAEKVANVRKAEEALRVANVTLDAEIRRTTQFVGSEVVKAVVNGSAA